MQDATVLMRKRRVNAFIPVELDERMTVFERSLGYTKTDLIKAALEEYLTRLEEEKIEKELEDGYKANSGYYNKMNEEWRIADSI